AHQCGHALRTLARHGAVEDLVGKQKGLDMRSDLREQSLGKILRRLLEQHRPKTQPAADRLFDNADALNRTIATPGPLCARERLPQFLDEPVVTSVDASKPLRTGSMIRDPRHQNPQPRRTLRYTKN